MDNQTVSLVDSLQASEEGGLLEDAGHDPPGGGVVWIPLKTVQPAWDTFCSPAYSCELRKKREPLWMISVQTRLGSRIKEQQLL